MKLTIGEAAKYLGVSVDSIRRWERKSLIKSFRSPGGHRYFLKTDLKALEEQRYKHVVPPKVHKSVPVVVEAVAPLPPPPPKIDKPIIRKEKVHPGLVVGLIAFIVIDAVLFYLYLLTKVRPL